MGRKNDQKEKLQKAAKGCMKLDFSKKPKMDIGQGDNSENYSENDNSINPFKNYKEFINIQIVRFSDTFSRFHTNSQKFDPPIKKASAALVLY